MSGVGLLLSGSLLLVGAILLLIASIGLLRFPDLYTRMHAVLKAGTVGALLVLFSLAVSAPQIDIVVRLAAASMFLLVGAPLCAVLLSSAASLPGARAASARSIAANRHHSL